jgi:hypothetical protein
MAKTKKNIKPIAYANRKSVKEITPVDFSKLPDVSKYANVNPKNKNLRNLGIIFLVIIIGIGVGIGLFFLINYFIK